MINAILKQFGFTENTYSITSFGSGLINNTRLVERGDKKYIVQRINQQVFKKPADIDENVRLIAAYLKQYYPAYLFTVPLSTLDNKTLVQYESGAYRIFEFIEGSITYNTLQKPKQAYEAAKQFGRFTRLLSGFNSESLKITLPDFHNLSLRYGQFETANTEGNKERIVFASTLIETLKGHAGIVATFEKIQHSGGFIKRVTHHDTKISNVLFDEKDNGICVIDLDTVMPGYFISDVGDMMRTYLAASGEEETNLAKIMIRDEYFDAIVRGYLGEMQEELSLAEINNFVYAGKFMIYMQALRFLADYLNDDSYYGAKYPLHNFNRAANQIVLLQQLISKEQLFNEKVQEFVNSPHLGNFEY